MPQNKCGKINVNVCLYNLDVKEEEDEYICCPQVANVGLAAMYFTYMINCIYLVNISDCFKKINIICNSRKCIAILTKLNCFYLYAE